MMEKNTSGTIPLGAPSWEDIMPAIIHILQSSNVDGKAAARDELMRVAKIVDKMQEEKEGKAST